MKKILLGTSALIGAAALFAGVAHADDSSSPKITLGGLSTFEGGYSSEDKKATLGNGASHAGGFYTHNLVLVKADGKTNAGLGYGGEIDLQADTTADSNNSAGSNVNAKRTFVYVDGKWGKLQGGSDLGVTKTMKVDASSIARASGGIDGDFNQFLSTPTGANTKVIATPDLFLDYGNGVLGNDDAEGVNKISYYTPRFAGLQAGVSYMFDTTSAGTTVNRINTSPNAKNVVLGALNYDNKFGGVGINLGATGEYGKSEDKTLRNLATYQGGAKVSYMGASVAGSYGRLGDSLVAKTTTQASSTYFWDLGAAYEVGAFGASVTYLKSQYANGTVASVDQGKNSFSNISVGADYKLAAGLKPFAEVNFVKYNPTGTVNDNKATIGLVGTQLQF